MKASALCWIPLACVVGSSFVATGAGSGRDAEFALHTFRRQQLTDEYFSEGANAGDINRDGVPDVVSGPYWYAGPDYRAKHEIYAPVPQNRKAYADNFFSWVYDFNGDGWNDVFVVGFPGTPAYVYENPQGDGLDKHWKKHTVFDSVANESPHFTQLVGDDRPELVCTSGGYFGFATVDWKKPLDKWTYHAISEKTAPNPFGHGLGVGDVNGDGLNDILTATGWFEQPREGAETGRWPFHAVAFTNSYGGTEMYAYDVDGDGDNDVITVLAAHDFGLAWYEQDRSDGKVTFRQHLIMGDRPEQNRYGLVFSEPHSVALVDMDGDGLKDIVTGKTYWSHHDKSPMWDAGAVVYWFRLVRTDQGVDWVPYKADGEAGIGRQVSVLDLNGDKLPDIVLGGMKGAHVLLHRRDKVTREQWQDAQPKPVAQPPAKTSRGREPALDKTTGRVADAVEGEELSVLSVSAGKTSHQAMSAFTRGRWSGAKQLLWTGAKPGDKLELQLDVAEPGRYDLSAGFTMARDYATVQLQLDDVPLGEPIELYNYPDVISTGELGLGTRELAAGRHRLAIAITGSHASALKAYMVGLDYIQLRRQ